MAAEESRLNPEWSSRNLTSRLVKVFHPRLSVVACRLIRVAIMDRNQAATMKRMIISLEDFNEEMMKSDGIGDVKMIVTTDSQRSRVHQLCPRSRPSQCPGSPSRCLLYPTECRFLRLASQVSSLKLNPSSLLRQDIELKNRLKWPSLRSTSLTICAFSSRT